MVKNVCPLLSCPLLNKPLINEDFINSVRRNTIPVCFHCGTPYVKDIQHTTKNYTTWKPKCTCVDKNTVRIVTGIPEYRG